MVMRPVSIIVPVYNAFDVTVDCLRSVSIHSPPSVRVVVIDDASPSGELVSVVPDEIKNDSRFVFIRNDRNLGFVGSCNRGMLFESDGDIILLNSDTVVTPRWVQKLIKAAYSRPRVGTVTPLTNNGTIASVPRFLENNELPSGMKLNQFAEVIEKVSAREYVSVPTCVGFCTYVRRSMLDAVGVFDPVFKRGYGEENDLSLRAAQRGFDNIIDDATYVYHRGSMSFKEMKEALSQENLKILNQRYPGYDAQIAAFCGANPLTRVHDRIWNHLQKEFVLTKERAVLHVLSNGPFFERGAALGDIELHVQSIIHSDRRSAHFSLVTGPTRFYLTAHLDCGDRTIILPDAFELSLILKGTLFDIAHIHDIGAFHVPRLVDAIQCHGRYLMSVHTEDVFRQDVMIEGGVKALVRGASRIVAYSSVAQEAVAQAGGEPSRIEVCSLENYPLIEGEGENAWISGLYESVGQVPKARADALAGVLQPDLVNNIRGQLGRFSSMIRRTLVRLETA